MKSSIRYTDFLTIQGIKHNIFAKDRLSPAIWWRLYSISLLATDMIMMILAFKLAYFIRFDSSFPVFQLLPPPSQSTYSSILLISVPVWVCIFIALGLYRRQNLLGGTEEYALVFRATTIQLFLAIIAGFLEPTFVIARGWLLLFWVLAFFFTAIGRFTLRRVVYFFRKKGHFLSPTLIVGANDEGLSLANQLLSWHTSGLKVLGFADKKLPAGTRLPGGIQVLGTVDQLDEIIEHFGIEELILASSAFSSRDNLLDIFKRHGISNGVNLRMSSGLYEIITTGLTVKEFAYVPLVGVNKVRLTGIDQVLKLILDFGITVPGLIFISPLLLAIALAIKLDSPGPILHRRRVMGVNKRQFNAYKFRTMYVNGDEIIKQYPELQAELVKNHKLKDDPRVTRLGCLLRKFSLDELPQLFNVLKLDMSLVGPRIICPEEMDNYNHWGLNLLTIRPGITGLWQVSGRSDISYEERIRLDMHYIRNWSIWLDLELLLRTIPAVIKSRGAY